MQRGMVTRTTIFARRHRVEAARLNSDEDTGLFHRDRSRVMFLILSIPTDAYLRLWWPSLTSGRFDDAILTSGICP